MLKKLQELHWSAVAVICCGFLCFALIITFAPQDRIDFLFPPAMRVTLRDLFLGANGLLWSALGIKAVLTKSEDVVRKSFRPPAETPSSEVTKP